MMEGMYDDDIDEDGDGDGDDNAFAYSREWTENGQLWVQQVSSTPATRLDVVNLQVCLKISRNNQ